MRESGKPVSGKKADLIDRLGGKVSAKKVSAKKVSAKKVSAKNGSVKPNDLYDLQYLFKKFRVQSTGDFNRDIIMLRKLVGPDITNMFNKYGIEIDQHFRKNLYYIAKDCKIEKDHPEFLNLNMVGKANMLARYCSGKPIPQFKKQDIKGQGGIVIPAVEKVKGGQVLDSTHYDANVAYEYAGILYIRYIYSDVACVLSPTLKNPIRSFSNSRFNYNKYAEATVHLSYLNDVMEFTINDELVKKLNYCIKSSKEKKKRFIVMILRLSTNDHAHQNILIYDKQLKQLQRFDPNGYTGIFGFKDINKLIQDGFKKHGLKIDSFLDTLDYCPRMGFQALEIGERPSSAIEIGGFCHIWAMWFLELRLKNPDMTIQQVTKYAMDSLKKVEYVNFIRNFSEFHNILVGILEQANGDKSKFQKELKKYIGE